MRQVKSTMQRKTIAGQQLEALSKQREKFEALIVNEEEYNIPEEEEMENED